jgi:uncharacterized damage-inducible protein DinB
MLCYNAEQFAASFRTVRSNTIQVAQDIHEDQYSHVPFEGGRTVGQMLTHIALSPTMVWIGMHGDRSKDVTKFDFASLVQRAHAEEAMPRSKAQIIDLLTSEGERFAEFLSSMSDADLSAQVMGNSAAGPAPRSRFEMLLSAKEHEMHHRAQLMLIERQLGIVPHLTRQMMARMEQMRARAGA